MKIENKLSEITRLIDNIKKHSDSLNGLKIIPVLEIGVILSKINKLQEETVVLKHFYEMQQGKRVELHSSNLIATTLSNEEHLEVSKVKKNKPEPKEGKGLEEDAMLSAKESSDNEAIDNRVEATISAEEKIDESSVEQETSPNLSLEDEKKKQDADKENEVDRPEQKTHLNEGLLDQILEEAKDEERENVQAESFVQNLEDNNEISPKPDINEALAKEDSSLSGHLQKQPIADLISAIGLNEQYLYANDLFEGDMQEFKNSIKMLNEFENIDDAKSFFESKLRTTYNWEDDNALAQALLNLIERRYL
tara:strand:+ start:29677 stop:30600 length:924 start_codon:yes stop_codon:yes gene_type:complete